MYIENLECAVYVSAVPNMDRSCLQSRKMDRATHGLVCRGMSSRCTQTREWVFATSVKIYLVRPFSMVPLCNGAGSVVRRESHSPYLKSYRIQELNNAKHVKLFAEAWKVAVLDTTLHTVCHFGSVCFPPTIGAHSSRRRGTHPGF